MALNKIYKEAIIMGNLVNRVLGESIIAVNDETKIAGDEVAQLEGYTLREYADVMFDFACKLGAMADENEEYANMNALEFLSKVFSGEIEL